MPDKSAGLEAAIADLDEGYLQVMLLLAVRRSGSEEPRRAALWHALATMLAEEQDQRSRADALGPGPDEPTSAEALPSAMEAVLAELRLDATVLEAECGVSGQAPPAEHSVASSPASGGSGDS